MTTWHTSNMRLATYLAIEGFCWPEIIRNNQDGRHLNFVYTERPEQELIDDFLSGNGDDVNRVLDVYHSLRSQLAQARDLGVDEVTFRIPT